MANLLGKPTCSSLKDQLPALMRPANSGVWKDFSMNGAIHGTNSYVNGLIQGKICREPLFYIIIDHYIYIYLQMFPSSTSGTMTELKRSPPWIWAQPTFAIHIFKWQSHQLSSHQAWWLQAGESPVLTSTLEQGNKLGKGRGNHHWRRYPQHIAGQSSRAANLGSLIIHIG